MDHVRTIVVLERLNFNPSRARLFYCMLTAEIEEIHAQTFLDMLVALWVTIRGFSLASTFIEMYKHDKKKGLQRSKSLRKELS